MMVLNFEDVVVFESIKRQQTLFKRLDARFVRLLLAEQRLAARVFHDAYPGQSRFLYAWVCAYRYHRTFCARRLSAR
jgi:hypothetical protein